MAIKDEAVVGIIIGTPLSETTQKYKGAFLDRPEDLDSLYFLGELAVKPEFKQLGVGQELYEEFERQVAEKKQFSGICVWQLQSEVAKPSGDFWREIGFVLVQMSNSKSSGKIPLARKKCLIPWSAGKSTYEQVYCINISADWRCYEPECL